MSERVTDTENEIGVACVRAADAIHVHKGGEHHDERDGDAGDDDAQLVAGAGGVGQRGGAADRGELGAGERRQRVEATEHGVAAQQHVRRARRQRDGRRVDDGNVGERGAGGAGGAHVAPIERAIAAPEDAVGGEQRAQADVERRRLWVDEQHGVVKLARKRDAARRRRVQRRESVRDVERARRAEVEARAVKERKGVGERLERERVLQAAVRRAARRRRGADRKADVVDVERVPQRVVVGAGAAVDVDDACAHDDGAIDGARALDGVDLARKVAHVERAVGGQLGKRLADGKRRLDAAQPLRRERVKRLKVDNGGN